MKDDYKNNFNASNYKIGIVGNGYVGTAVHNVFKTTYKTLVFDKNPNVSINDFHRTILESDVLFICIPTPMNSDGSCCTRIVENVLDDICNVLESFGKSKDELVIVIKSTVHITFTDVMRKEKKLRLVFSPEFLIEKNFIDDFKNTNRIILGGEERDCDFLTKIFENAVGFIRDPIIVCCQSTTAEIVKLFTNAFLFNKILFANEFYFLCEKLGINLDEVIALSALDRRIAYSYFKVPESDGDFGVGDNCFIKDLNNLVSFFKNNNLQQEIFTAILKRNDELRNNIGLEKMKDRDFIEKESKMQKIVENTKKT